MRRRWRVALPVAAGLATALAVLVVPHVPVHGTLATGPIPPGHPAPPWNPGDVGVAWADGHRSIAVHVRTGAACPPRLAGSTSLAPARVEVHVLLTRGAACAADPVTTRFLVPAPSVAEPGQGVIAVVDGQRFDLPSYRR